MTENQTNLYNIISDTLIGYVLKEEIPEVSTKIIEGMKEKRLIIIDTNDIENIANKIKEGD